MIAEMQILLKSFTVGSRGKIWWFVITSINSEFFSFLIGQQFSEASLVEHRGPDSEAQQSGQKTVTGKSCSVDTRCGVLCLNFADILTRILEP